MRHLSFFYFLVLFISQLTAAIPQSGKNYIEYKKQKYEIWMRMADDYKKHTKDSGEISEKFNKLFKGFILYECILKGFPSSQELG